MPLLARVRNLGRLHLPNFKNRAATCAKLVQQRFSNKEEEETIRDLIYDLFTELCCGLLKTIGEAIEESAQVVRTSFVSNPVQTHFDPVSKFERRDMSVPWSFLEIIAYCLWEQDWRAWRL